MTVIHSKQFFNNSKLCRCVCVRTFFSRRVTPLKMLCFSFKTNTRGTYAIFSFIYFDCYSFAGAAAAITLQMHGFKLYTFNRIKIIMNYFGFCYVVVSLLLFSTIILFCRFSVEFNSISLFQMDFSSAMFCNIHCIYFQLEKVEVKTD